MAGSAEIRRTKTRLAAAVVASVYGMDHPTATPDRLAVVAALTELSLDRLRRLCREVGLDSNGKEIT